jgi:hypothetical protein
MGYMDLMSKAENVNLLGKLVENFVVEERDWIVFMI